MQTVSFQEPKGRKRVDPLDYDILQRNEHMAAEWTHAFQEAKKHAAVEAKVFQELTDAMESQGNTNQKELYAKLKNYSALHLKALDRGLYHRVEDLLYKLRQIERTTVRDPHRVMQLRGMIADLEREKATMDSDFQTQSVEKFRLAEEKAWKEVVESHQEWSNRHGGEMEQVFANFANRVGVVRKSEDQVFDRAAADKTRKESGRQQAA
ncbi:MAG: hypothetical protein Q7N87_04825 [Candidatus Uhrbacteria bacterium]|nr:hypothetical protein [Candidatus Uhrbacteria bacterium]